MDETGKFAKQNLRLGLLQASVHLLGLNRNHVAGSRLPVRTHLIAFVFGVVPVSLLNTLVVEHNLLP